jgi:tetratricopeptide (TPR) repeat protein
MISLTIAVVKYRKPRDFGQVIKAYVYQTSHLTNKTMKNDMYLRIALTFLVALCALTASAQGITTPRTPSPAAKVSQTIGISTVEVTYSRPSVNGREIWGKLVPYGYNVQNFGAQNEAPWRSGANENTTITFSHPVEVAGNSVPAGTYGLFFVINEDNSGEVVLSRDYQSWGSFWYDPKQDQLRTPIQIRDVVHIETLSYDFINLDKNSGELVLNWEKKQFPIKISFAVDEIVMANATEELKGVKGFNWQGYSSAANYALQNKTNLDQGLVWIDKAIAQNKTFPMLVIKADLLKETGKPADATALMTEALTLATEFELNNRGYQLINQSKNTEAIEIFKLATERFPTSANAWDSLGEGYALSGDEKKAIASFKKSLKMNPPENVRANSEKYLKQFGAM